MTIQDIIHKQLNVRCMQVNPRGYLQPFQCENPESARLYIFRTEQTYLVYLREDVPPLLRQHLKLQAPDILFNDHALIQRTLAEHHPCEDVFSGKTYILPPDIVDLSHTIDTAIYNEDATHYIEQNGVRVATCSSVRENDTVAEAWVFTDENHRGQGYGRAVVLAWAHHILRKNKLPFFTHHTDNTASQKLISTLPFEWCYDVVTYA